MRLKPSGGDSEPRQSLSRCQHDRSFAPGAGLAGPGRTVTAVTVTVTASGTGMPVIVTVLPVHHHTSD